MCLKLAEHVKKTEFPVILVGGGLLHWIAQRPASGNFLECLPKDKGAMRK
jgi:hypothetical protein